MLRHRLTRIHIFHHTYTHSLTNTKLGAGPRKGGHSFISFWVCASIRPSVSPLSSLQFPSKENQGSVSQVNAWTGALAWMLLSLWLKGPLVREPGAGVPQWWGLEKTLKNIYSFPWDWSRNKARLLLRRSLTVSATMRPSCLNPAPCTHSQMAPENSQGVRKECPLAEKSLDIWVYQKERFWFLEVHFFHV